MDSTAKAAGSVHGGIYKQCAEGIGQATERAATAGGTGQAEGGCPTTSGFVDLLRIGSHQTCITSMFEPGAVTKYVPIGPFGPFFGFHQISISPTGRISTPVHASSSVTDQCCPACLHGTAQKCVCTAAAVDAVTPYDLALPPSQVQYSYAAQLKWLQAD
ncbi:hypothetical protein HaLaN_10308, partial [Haematococcus lacustris]